MIRIRSEEYEAATWKLLGAVGAIPFDDPMGPVGHVKRQFGNGAAYLIYRVVMRCDVTIGMWGQVEDPDVPQTIAALREAIVRELGGDAGDLCPARIRECRGRSP